MALQVNIFLLLFGGLQGFLLSIFLLHRKLYRSAYIFLVGYILVMILQITLKVVSKVWLIENISPLYVASYRFPFLYGPLVYLLTAFLLGRKKQFLSGDLLHFIPFVLNLVVLFYYFSTRADNLLTRAFMDADITTVSQLVSILIYHALALRSWNQHKSEIKNYFSEIRLFQLKWLRQFIWASALVCSLITMAIYFMYLYFPHLNDLKFAFALLTVFIYWVSYVALKQPQLFSVTHGHSNEEISTPSIAKLVVHRRGNKYQNSGLGEDEASRIIESLQKLMTSRKFFLEPGITIENLAAAIPCSRHHLSQVLNDKISKSFFDYINHYRVEESKILLTDPRYSHHKISSIAYDAGFNSLSTFNEVFRKLTGQTPSEFRKQQNTLSRNQRTG